MIRRSFPGLLCWNWAVDAQCAINGHENGQFFAKRQCSIDALIKWIKFAATDAKDATCGWNPIWPTKGHDYSLFGLGREDMTKSEIWIKVPKEIAYIAIPKGVGKVARKRGARFRKYDASLSLEIPFCLVQCSIEQTRGLEDKARS